MYQRRTVVAASVGLHARPAGLLARVAAGGPTPVRIAKIVDGTPTAAVDMSSVLSLMTLGAAHGDEVELTAEGERAEEAVRTLIALIEQDLDA